jgi:hypothetical protein
MKAPKTVTRIATAAGALALAGVAFGAAASAATAATPAPRAPRQVEHAQDDSCSAGFTKGWTSVDLVITNKTSFPLTFDPSLSGPSSGHWNQRPLETLAPGQCEVVNAYAPTDVHIFSLNVVYNTPWGDYMPFMGNANNTEPSFNPDVFEGVPEYHKNNYYWSGAIDSRYGITSSGQSGLLHTHFNLALS